MVNLDPIRREMILFVGSGKNTLIAIIRLLARRQWHLAKTSKNVFLLERVMRLARKLIGIGGQNLA